jgi:hypothetical protein
LMHLSRSRATPQRALAWTILSRVFSNLHSTHVYLQERRLVFSLFMELGFPVWLYHGLLGEGSLSVLVPIVDLLYDASQSPRTELDVAGWTWTSFVKSLKLVHMQHPLDALGHTKGGSMPADLKERALLVSAWIQSH